MSNILHVIAGFSEGKKGMYPDYFCLFNSGLIIEQNLRWIRCLIK